MAQAVLIVDDEETLARNIASYLAIAGFEAHAASTGAQALAAHAKHQPDITLLDLRLPDQSGLDVLRVLQERNRDHPVIMMTAYGEIETAVAAMKCGAHDFLRKPLVLGEVRHLVERTLSEERRSVAIGHMAQASTGSAVDTIIGTSSAVRRLKESILLLGEAERAMRSDAAPPVLICGETGTGKELVARAIHRAGGRASGPFIEINCAALPLKLVESELFGHERGAFTDAHSRKIGLIEAADGGTLFLDEIGEMDLATQAKILKVMEDRMVRRVGGMRSRMVDVRFVAATNRDLAAEAALGRFREDLLFRLQVAQFELPPLRAREGDILLLARTFLQALSRRYGRETPVLSESACACLCSHDWPGNVRELRNVLERALLFNPGGRLGADAFALAHQSARGTAGLEQERALVQDALARAGWNVSKAARQLNLSRDQLRYRIDKFALRAAAE